MPQQKTFEEIEAEAKKLFGPHAEVSFSDGQWLIATGIQEKFDPEDHKEAYPHAYEASKEYEANYGSTLDRWAAKNGHSWESELETWKAYEEMVVREFKNALALVRESIAKNRPFDWPGGEDYKNRILAAAEERGW